jgi:hypothetical protein
MGKKGKKANNEKQSRILKEGGSEPKPIGDHRENETVATKAMVGGETNFETKSAKPESISALELVSLL